MLYNINEDSFTPMSKGIEAATLTAGMHQLTGGSGRGWSRFKLLQSCPYAYYLRYIKKPDKVEAVEFESAALAIGSAVHALLAVYYEQKMGHIKTTPEQFRDMLSNLNVNPDRLNTAWRSFAAYACKYEQDYIVPLATEYPVTDKAGFTCRYDGIVRVENAPETVQAGTFILEHKTTSSFSEEVIDGWDIDGEILGEIAFWQRNGLDAKFGKLTGVIINIIGKQKVPQFWRTFVNPLSARTKVHIRNLNWMVKLEEQCLKTGVWPQYFGNCIGRYGKCQFYSYCLNKDIE